MTKEEELAEIDRDPIAYLSKLLAESGARVTMDARRSMADPCWMCGTSKAPRDLVTIGTYTRPMGGNLRPGDRIDRPLCASCEKLTQPPPAPAEAAPMPDPESFPVRLILPLRDHDEHLEMVQLGREVGLDFDAWALKVLRAAAKEAKMRR